MAVRMIASERARGKLARPEAEAVLCRARAAPSRLGLHLPLPQWLRICFAAAAGSRFTTVAPFSVFVPASPGPRLHLSGPRSQKQRVVLRPFEPRGQPSPKVSGLGHRLRPRAESERTRAETESGLETPELCSPV